MTLGIDIGGTTINLGLVDGPRILKKVQIPSFSKGATLNETLTYLADQIAAFLVPGVAKIGIGVPSLTLRCSYPYQAALDNLKITAMPDEDTALVGAASLA